RMLLETVWELFERAGYLPEHVEGTRTGVYIGVTSPEYFARVIADASSIDAYSILGTSHSAMIGRISYWLGLQGPNFPVDTACSSALLATHLAVQGLRNGECDMA